MRIRSGAFCSLKKNHLWLLNYSHRSWFEIWFPEKDFALGKGAVNIINVTANDLENYINLIDKNYIDPSGRV